MNKLQRFRIDAGMTQKQLAKKSGLSLRCIQALEEGTRSLDRIRPLTRHQLAKALKIKEGDL